MALSRGSGARSAVRLEADAVDAAVVVFQLLRATGWQAAHGTVRDQASCLCCDYGNLHMYERFWHSPPACLLSVYRMYAFTTPSSSRW